MQLELDISDLNNKLNAVLQSLDLIKGDYKFKKARYQESKLKLDELRVYKEKVKNQMNGFLIMYEIKKEETLKELSKKLQTSTRYKEERVF